ncbi:TRAP transporter small permease subunit [Silanimonas sp.]|jgi:TRAP-type mannitol/chloroaromatic compound transport system permease small subunit|uniref:TRAP transporter small permease subunit n=1 Tax=Silanimonas sp. TaxID=1929290 RepID=UPI0022BE6435|nr:TRAP transporter small permease subunit [Silanimonas sp.]MCZ8064267.1 TRAP transporter small permease subunit [Silanimonas sp.]MCZ8115776.1 TRAP transporter small permease subunit [Silanimonas sp.]
MGSIQKIIDGTSEVCGHVAALAATALVVLTAGLVLAFSLGVGSVRLQDLVLWLNAGMVMLGLGYALKYRAHVRIDVFSSRWSARTVARIEVLGILVLLLPLCAAIAWLSFDYVAMSWRVSERSASSGGLAGLYLAKTLLPVGALLLALQGLAEGLRALPLALGRPASPLATTEPRA